MWKGVWWRESTTTKHSAKHAAQGRETATDEFIWEDRGIHPCRSLFHHNYTSCSIRNCSFIENEIIKNDILCNFK